MKRFLDGFEKGINAFAPVVGGAIGGMLLVKGCIEKETISIVLGVFVIVANMISSYMWKK
ncbi:MAG: hypothetical protein MJZ34_06930 [Paludibacteraceae bacterium]|nr:hypothetical protein [Paludibacteraceae bacterium]